MRGIRSALVTACLLGMIGACSGDDGSQPSADADSPPASTTTIAPAGEEFGREVVEEGTPTPGAP